MKQNSLFDDASSPMPPFHIDGGIVICKAALDVYNGDIANMFDLDSKFINGEQLW